MTEAQLTLDPGSGAVSLRLHIDLLRPAGSTEAYLELAQNLQEERYRPLWRALSDAIVIEQNGIRLPLEFESATPPQPVDPSAFDDPFVWPRVWVSLDAQNYQPHHPVTVVFTSAFVFEEPISITISDGTNRLSRWLVTSQRSPRFQGSESIATPATDSEPFASYLSSLRAGFTHIVPYGWDHLMFVLAVLLLCATLKQTVLLVTAFTLGHSVSLAVAGFKIVSIPASVVEPLILLSISLYALRAMSAQRATRTSIPRPVLWPVALIGLVHGLGFAAAFSKLDWSGSPIGHLFGFNLGIELAQLLFVTLAYPVVSRLSPSNARHLALLLVLGPLTVALGRIA